MIRGDSIKDENDTLEYKKSLAQLKEGVISLSSMLNKKHHGELYFGIAPNKKPYPFLITKNTLQDVSNEVQGNLKPLPNRLLDIEVVNIEEVDREKQDIGMFFKK